MFHRRSLVVLLALCAFGAIHSMSLVRNQYQGNKLGLVYGNYSRPVNQTWGIPNRPPPPSGGFPYNKRNQTYVPYYPPPGQNWGVPARNQSYFPPNNSGTWPGRPVNNSRPYFG